MDGSTIIALAGIGTTGAVGIAAPLLNAYFERRRGDQREFRDLLDEATGTLVHAVELWHDILTEGPHLRDMLTLENPDQDETALDAEVVKQRLALWRRFNTAQYRVLAMHDKLAHRLPEEHHVLRTYGQAGALLRTRGGELSKLGTPDEPQDLQADLDEATALLDRVRAMFADSARDVIASTIPPTPLPPEHRYPLPTRGPWVW
jgi:hypothetical protein